MVKPPQKPTMSKIEKAEEPTIATTSPTIDSEIEKADAPKPEPLPNVSTISDADLQAMLKVLRTEVRRRENEREASRPKVGSKVRILRGRPKYVGKVGTAVVVRKSRCFVAVPEVDAPAYLLITDVELVER